MGVMKAGMQQGRDAKKAVVVTLTGQLRRLRVWGHIL